MNNHFTGLDTAEVKMKISLITDVFQNSSHQELDLSMSSLLILLMVI